MAPAEFKHRAKILWSQVQAIKQEEEQIKSLNLSYKVGLNEHSDLSDEEFDAKYLMDPEVVKQLEDEEQAMPKGAPAMPIPKGDPSIQEIDWVAKGKVTPVIHQGNCGACWAVAAVSTIESAMAIARNKLVKLSTQQVLDC